MTEETIKILFKLKRGEITATDANNLINEQHDAEMVLFAEWIMNNVDDSFQGKDSYQWIVDSRYEPSIPTTDLLTLFKNRNK